ncbi:hypothetical protein VPH35_007658 [Triticum aestivum]
MEASVAVRGKSAAMQCDAVLAMRAAVVEARRSRRTCVVSQRLQRLGATIVEAQWRVAWRCGVSAEDIVAQCYVMKRHPGRLAFKRDGINGVCRRGTPGMCRRRRRISAYVAGDVTDHDAIGVSAPGRVRERGHGRGDDIGMSYSGDGEAVA